MTDNFTDTGPLGSIQLPPYWYHQSNSPIQPVCNNFNADLNRQPLTYPIQMYPKTPWYYMEGAKCTTQGDCGPISSCVNGRCMANKN